MFRYYLGGLNLKGVNVYGLGGLGEFGKNMYIVEVDDFIFILDAGFSFPENNHYSIKFIIPDVSYLLDKVERIKGIFLTHGHEEQIGALAFLIEQINVPVYGSDLTIRLAQEKLGHLKYTKNEQFHIIDQHSELFFDDLRISFIYMTHSIPGNYGICIHTRYGNVFYTGDFKIDFQPIDENRIDFEQLNGLRKEGVLFLLSDSTNADKLGYAPSEKSVGEKLFEIFEKSNERIFITTFSTSIYRFQLIIDTANKTNRKVAVIGTKIIQTIEIARELGYLNFPDDIYISPTEINNYSRESVVVLISGCQGEKGSVLSNIANGSNYFVKVEKGDLFIFSSSVIPGNEIAISRNIDKLLRLGAKVIDKGVHSSGHGYQEDLKAMIATLSPRFTIPVNSEYRLQKEFQKIAIQMNVHPQNTFILNNGEIVSYTDSGIIQGEKIKVSSVYIDNMQFTNVDNTVMRDRVRLSENGAFIIILVLEKRTRKLMMRPILETEGFIGCSIPDELVNEVFEITENIVNYYSRDFITLKNKLRESIQQLLYEKLKRRPLIIPTIIEK